MADMEYTCPECAGRFVVDEGNTGIEVVCPHCSARVMIPAAAPPLAAPLSRDAAMSYCPNCGAPNTPQARRCLNCGHLLEPAPQGPTPTGHVPNYLVQAIIVTLLCCLPFGIPAIVYAAQVDGKLRAGDYEGALASSNKARMWCWLAFAFGLVACVIGFAVGVISAAAGAP